MPSEIKLAIVLILLTFTMMLTSCSTTKAPVADVSLQSVNYLNPDINGRSSPVVVTFYELQSPNGFKQAKYYPLTENAGKILGNDLVDKRIIEVQPGQITKKTVTLSPNTKYLGITAAYRNINQAKWKAILTVPPKTHKVKLSLILESQGLYAKIKK